MGSTDVLRILTAVDVGPLQAGMSQAAAAVQASTDKMASSFKQLQGSSLLLPAGMVSGMNTAAASAESSVAGIGAAVESHMGSGSHSMHAIRGLGEEIGVHMPRFVSSFLASMGPVAGIMAAAFPVIAAVGLIEVIGQIPEAIDKGINALRGWDEEAKKAYADAEASITKTMKAFSEFERTVKLAQATAGLSGTAKLSAEQNELQRQLDRSNDEFNKLSAASTAATEKLRMLSAGHTELSEKMFDSNKAADRLSASVVGFFHKIGTGEEVDKAKTDLAEITKRLEDIKVVRDSLNQRLTILPIDKKVASNEENKKAIDERNEAAIQEIRIAQYVDDQNEAYMKKQTEAAAKEFAETARLAMVSAMSEIEEGAKVTEEAYKQRQKQIEDAKRLAAENLKFENSMADQLLSATLKTDDQKLAHQQITLGKWAADEKKAIAAWLADEEKASADYIEQLKKNGETDPVIYQKEQDRITLIRQKAEQEREKIDQKEQQSVQKMAAKIDDYMFSGFNKWIQGQATFAQAMGQSWNKMLMDLIQYEEKKVARWLATEAMHAMIAMTATATDEAADEEQNAIKSKGIIKSAAHAAAQAWEALSPIPIVGPVLGAAAAAATFAGVMAFGSFKQGGILDKDQFMFGHAKEMMLPEHISTGLQNMINSGQTSGGSSGNLHINYQPTIIGGEQWMQRQLDAHSNHLAKLMKQKQREGALPGYGI